MAARTYIVRILHLGELTRIGPNPTVISSRSHLAVWLVRGACMGVGLTLTSLDSGVSLVSYSCYISSHPRATPRCICLIAAASTRGPGPGRALTSQRLRNRRLASALPSPPSISSRKLSMACSSSLCLSSGVTPSTGVMSPTLVISCDMILAFFPSGQLTVLLRGRELAPSTSSALYTTDMIRTVAEGEKGNDGP